VDETVFLLIRHAESTWNAAGRWQGQADPPLSERGRRQAAGLARDLAGERVDCLVASDLARARETAAILAETWGLRLRLDPSLRELDVGAWTGLTRVEIRAREAEALSRFESGVPDARPGGGESRRELRRRVRAAVAGIAATHVGQRVALVTHLGAVRALRPGTELANAGWCCARAGELAPPFLDAGRV
jgi:broad specificity phosphatase PhoE